MRGHGPNRASVRATKVNERKARYTAARDRLFKVAIAQKYQELERRLLDECEFLRNIEKTLTMDKERLQKECEEWKT